MSELSPQCLQQAQRSSKKYWNSSGQSGWTRLHCVLKKLITDATGKYYIYYCFLYLCVHCSVAKSCSVFTIPQNATCPASLSFTISRSLLQLVSIESVMPSHPLSLPFLFCLQFFPASGSFPVNWLFTSGG